MLEDKLSADQRIRLEAVAQANVLLAHLNMQGFGSTARTATLIRCADRIAKYVGGGTVTELRPGGGDHAA